MLRTRSPRKEKISNCYLHSNSLSNKMDNSLLAVRDINHKYIVVEKEVKEETGFTVTAEKNIAVQDWRKHNVMNYAYGVIKIFVMCKYESGKFEDNIETTQIAFFDKDSLPEKLAVEKCTKEQVLMCFKSYENHELLSYFD